MPSWEMQNHSWNTIISLPIPVAVSNRLLRLPFRENNTHALRVLGALVVASELILQFRIKFLPCLKIYMVN